MAAMLQPFYMPINQPFFTQLKQETDASAICLVAVSKTKPMADIQALYALGQRHFGENYVQELIIKYEALPKDICWHFIGHLQSNKVKQIAPFVHLIHGVDSSKLLVEINKEAIKNSRPINCLLQLHIAKEETKFGLNEQELKDIMAASHQFKKANIEGLMGMASNTNEATVLQSEFENLHRLYQQYKLTNPQAPLRILSMGMSSDYKTAIACGSNMIRIGSLLFGQRG